MQMYQRLRAVGLGATVLVPLFALIPGASIVPKLIAAGLAAVAAFTQGFEGIHQYREHYITWRFTSEQIEREIYEYKVKIGDYAPGKSQEDHAQLLAEHVEAMTSQENQQWLTTQQKPDATSVVKS